MYHVLLHKWVLKKDLKALSKKEESRILRIIKKKLSKDPVAFGKPLRGDLKGYYRLRVDPYRVIYRIEEKRVTVWVIQVGLRRDFEVYLQAAKRLGLL